jgi:AraC-like DNA-binding protein
MNTLAFKPTMPLHLEAPQHRGLESWESLAFGANFRVYRLAQLCQVSVRTLQRHFRKHYNVTLSDWLRDFRLETSRAMLKDAPCVKTVAYDLGYKQPSHFTRDFKSRFGVPPKAYQLAARGSLPSPVSLYDAEANWFSTSLHRAATPAYANC